MEQIVIRLESARACLISSRRPYRVEVVAGHMPSVWPCVSSEVHLFNAQGITIDIIGCHRASLDSASQQLLQFISRHGLVLFILISSLRAGRTAFHTHHQAIDCRAASRHHRGPLFFAPFAMASSKRKTKRVMAIPCLQPSHSWESSACVPLLKISHG